ncbi:MAG: branched-chain amino acid ABC transporter ATP-binding protein/permease [Sporichthyaceae bacterium]
MNAVKSLLPKIPTLGRVEGAHTTTRPVLTSITTPGSILFIFVIVTWPMWRPNYLVYSANSAIPIAIAALGLLVLVGWARELSLATAGIFASAAYLDGFLNREVGGPGWPWVFAALAVILGAGLVMALLALSSSRLPGIYLLVLTFGLQVVIERTIFTYGRFSGGLGGGDEDGNIVVNRRPQFFGIDLRNESTQQILGMDLNPETIFYFFSLFWMAIVLALIVRLRRSPMGLGFILVGADRQAAAAIGVNPLRFRVYAFTLSGLLAGTGGVLLNWLFINPPVFYNYLSPYSLVLLAIPILAGLDSIAFVLFVAAGFQLVPVMMESLRISTFILAAVGLIGGAVFGSRGMGGRARDAYRYLMYGDRRTRTKRERVATDVMRRSNVDIGDAADQLTPEQRSAALAVLEHWLPPRAETTYAAKADNIKVVFGSIKALDDASIVVPTHQMVGLLGPNGAGKTTLFDVISGVRKPTHGKVSLFDNDVTGMSAWDRSKLGMARTFQTTRVMTDLTVGDNLIAGAYQRIKSHPALFLAGMPSAWQEMRQAEEAAFAAAQLLDIDRYWNERCGSLEFSARRRAEIGRCLLAGPRLLLLDEPAAGLDPASSVALFTLIKKLHEDLGLTVLIVEHYVKAILDSCDLVYVLAEGKILAQGTPEEVANDPEVRSRYLGNRMKYTPKARVNAEDAIGSANGNGRHAGAAQDEVSLDKAPAEKGELEGSTTT